MKAIFLGAMAALSLAFAAQAQSPGPADRRHIAEMEAGLHPLSAPASGASAVRTLQARMAETGTPGVSIAFIENGRVKWTKSYGVAEAGAATPVTPQTLFQAASLSKGVAAAAALRLVEQGRLDLDQDVNARLKSWKLPTSEFTTSTPVTLRQLLSHTAGLSVHGFPGYVAGKPLPTTAQILNGAPPANTKPVVSNAKPGSVWSYSGGGYTVAQLLMTDVTGEPFPRLMDRLVLRPAGMRRSTFEQPLPERRIPQAATGHRKTGLPIPGKRNVYPEYAAAGLWTTPADYGRFVIGLQNSYAGRPGALLRPATGRAVMTPVLNKYGLGVEVGDWKGRPSFEHGGSNEGFQSYYVALLDGSRQGVVVMTNSDGGYTLSIEIMRALGHSYGWDGPDKPASP